MADCPREYHSSDLFKSYPLMFAGKEFFIKGTQEKMLHALLMDWLCDSRSKGMVTDYKKFVIEDDPGFRLATYFLVAGGSLAGIHVKEPQDPSSTLTVSFEGGHTKADAKAYSDFLGHVKKKDLSEVMALASSACVVPRQYHISGRLLPEHPVSEGSAVEYRREDVVKSLPDLLSISDPDPDVQSLLLHVLFKGWLEAAARQGSLSDYSKLLLRNLSSKERICLYSIASEGSVHFVQVKDCRINKGASPLNCASHIVFSEDSFQLARDFFDYVNVQDPLRLKRSGESLYCKHTPKELISERWARMFTGIRNLIGKCSGYIGGKLDPSAEGRSS